MSIKMKNVSVDTETWGTRAGSDIRSIGAFLFDPFDPICQITEENTFYIACENPLMGSYSPNAELDYLDGSYRKYNLKRDPKTVKWWHDLIKSTDSEELKTAFDNPVELKMSLLKFSEFLYSISEDVRDGVVHDILTWSHGAGFDPPILEAAYIACDLKYPLFYRAPRDTRTVYDDAGIEDHSAHQKNHQQGPLHHAMWDSISQARAISHAKVSIHFVYQGMLSSAIECLEKIADPEIIRDGIAQREIAKRGLEEVALMKEIFLKEKT